MKKSVIIFLSLMVVMPIFGRAIHTNKKVMKSLPKKMPKLQEPIYINTFGADHRFGPKVQHSSRDDHFTAVLLDSSLNGYGP